MSFERNIKLSYAISSLSWVRFFIPVLALFYIASQVPIEQFAIIMSVYSLTIVLLEVPSGVIADILGKKKTLAAAMLMFIIELGIVSFFNGFFPFLIAKIISGIGASIFSGTNEALLYDTLKRLKREKEYKKISGKLGMIDNITKACVFILGAFLFAYNNKLPATLSLPFNILGFMLVLFLKEPYRSGKKLRLRTSYEHMKEGLAYFKGYDYIKYIVFFSLPVGATLNMMLSMSSAYFAQISIPVSLIGILAFASSMITALSYRKAHALEERIGEKKSLMIIQLLLISGVLLSSLMIPYVGFLFYLLFAVVNGFSPVVTRDYFNKHVKTSHRATMISIRRLFENVGVFLFFPILGQITKTYSMQTAFLTLLSALTVYAVGLAFYSNRLFKRLNHQ